MSESLPSRLPWRRIALFWALSRLWVVVVSWLGLNAIALGPHYGPVPRRFWDLVLRWDGNWYWGIATNGYQYKDGAASATAFFPGFPWLTAVVNALLPIRDVPLAPLLISNLCLLGSGLLLWRLAASAAAGRPQPERRADLVVALLFFTPVSIFFSVVYSESQFLFLCLASLVALQSQRWLLAGLLGAAAALTRNGGVFLGLPIALMAFQQWRAGNRSWLPWLCAALPAAGTLTFFAFLSWKFSTPTVFTDSQIHWGRRLTWPWLSFTPDHLAGFPFFYRVWFVTAGLLGIALMTWAWFAKLDRRIWAFGALLMLFNFSANHLESIPRYLSVIPPLYLVFALVPERLRPYSWGAVAVSASLMAISTLLFINGYWFT